MRKVYFEDLGLIEYGDAWQKQEELLKIAVGIKSAKVNGDSEVAQQSIKNYLLLCEHPHVYTLGKSGHMENLLVSNERLKAMGASFYKTNRGGDITYHGPGQVVGYPVLDLEQFATDLGLYMRNLEQVVINTLSHYNLKAGRLEGATGVWLDEHDPAKARKICAMGVRASRWVTIHGFALNVNTDMSFFDNIVPCGITDKAVTSLERELGHKIDEQEVKEHIKREFSNVFDTEITEAEYSIERKS